VPPPDRASSRSVSESNDVVVVNSGSKADKLPTAVSVNTTKVVAVEPQTPVMADQKRHEPVQTEIKSWHWSQHSNKITRK
jgi:hypothetical protein